MNNRALGFFSLLAVVGVSIVFGMLIGGKLNAPEVALAAPSADPLRLAPAASGPAPGADFADVVERVIPAVVSVTSTKLPGEGEDEPESRRSPSREDLFRWFFGPEDDPRRPQSEPRIGQGSGFVISDDGYVLTNNHVVEGADEVEVGFQDGEILRAKVVGTDPSIDLALLKVDAKDLDLPVLALGDSSALRVGQWVIAIGNPHEFEHTVTVGVVSGKERRVPVGGTDTGVVSFIQTDAAINLGNSGGPLLDASGNVVGINTAIRRSNFAEGIGFALPINQARGVIGQLRERGFVKRGYIGISMNPNGIDAAARDYYELPDLDGVIVDDVSDDGPAERAGIHRNDVIRKVDGERVRDNLDLISKISSHQPGDEIRLELLRDGKKVEVRATLEDREEGLRASGRGLPPNHPEIEEPESSESSGLGITVENLNRRLRERLELEDDQRGVVVTSVDFTGEAADKGIGRDMLITGINDRPVRGLDDWTEIIDGLNPGSAVKLDVLAGARSFVVFLRVPEE